MRRSRLMGILLMPLLMVPRPLLAAEEEAEAEGDSRAAEFSEVSVPLMAVTLGTILMDGDWRASDAARYCLDAMASAEIAAEVLKRIVKQPRPCDSHSEDGFPSGHTAVAFAFAHSLADWKPSASPVLYAFAATAGWARVEEHRHTWAQVAAGAAVGALVSDLSLRMNGGLLQGAIAPSRFAQDSDWNLPQAVLRGGYTIWETQW